MDFSEVYDNANTVAEQAIEGLPQVNGKKLNLDLRAGYNLIVGEDFIAVHKRDQRTLEYYGGFEYVDKDSVIGVGEYIFYSSEDDRVARCIDYFNDKDEEENEDE